jgi:lipopolysaccharide/colanic/teichoic acid biosynthesis glycosyltransferase
MLAVVFLIKMDSRGPAIIRRDRCLADGNTDALWEFRTSDGDPDNVSDGAAPSTALGVFLRDSRLDRLPRLINMLGGDVSIQSLLR